MIKKVLMGIFCLAAPLMGLSNDILKKAEKAYDERNYRLAVETYQSLVDKGYKSFELYFNLGNAYYRNNNLGKAIFYYELARKIEPEDEDVRINLAMANSKTQDQIESKENFFINAVKTNVLTSFSTATWAWLTIISLAISSLLFFLFISSQRVAIKRVMFVLSALLFLTFIITYSLGYSAMKSKYENKFAIIIAGEVRVMNEPTPGATMKFLLHEGTKIRVVEKNGDWVLIKLDNGNEGWLKLADVGII